MSVDTNTLLAIPSHVYARPFGAEMVLLDFAKGEYFGLDEVGAVLWSTAERGGSVADAASKIVEQFAAEREVVERDLLHLVGELLSQGLLSATPAGAGGVR